MLDCRCARRSWGTGDRANDLNVQHARVFLEPIKERHPWISYAEYAPQPWLLASPELTPPTRSLWTLAGVVAIEAMGGPAIPWKAGRTDFVDDSKVRLSLLADAGSAADGPFLRQCPPRGRLPDASQASQHLRDVFYRMGFNDQEIVALSGAHSLGVRSIRLRGVGWGS